MHVDILFGQALPQVNDIALIGQRYGLFIGHGTADAAHKLREIFMHLIHPSLGVAFLRGGRIDFSHYADNT